MRSTSPLRSCRLHFPGSSISRSAPACRKVRAITDKSEVIRLCAEVSAVGRRNNSFYGGRGRSSFHLAQFRWKPGEVFPALLRRIVCREGRAAGLVRGMEVHQFQADAVGGVEVELALAVLADLGGLIGHHAGQTVAVLKGFEGRVNRHDSDGEVVKHAELVLRDAGRDTRA